jgi:hypothetical protein
MIFYEKYYYVKFQKETPLPGYKDLTPL